MIIYLVMDESWASLYTLLGRKKFNMDKKKNGSDVQSTSFGMQLEIERSNDERQENFLE